MRSDRCNVRFGMPASWDFPCQSLRKSPMLSDTIQKVIILEVFGSFDFLKECHVLNQDLSFLCSFGAAIDVPVLGGIHSGVEEAKGSENLDSNRVGSNNSNSLEMSRDV